MSTYLLAFIVGELESITGKTDGGTEFSVYTTPGKLAQAAFALDTGIKVLNFFEDYFGVRIPFQSRIWSGFQISRLGQWKTGV